MKYRENIPVISISLVIIFTNISLCLTEITFEKQQSQEPFQQHSQQQKNTILDNFTWDCANNASCINSIAKNVMNRYQRKETIDFGLFSIKSLPSSISSNYNKQQKNLGRSSSTSASFVDFLSDNVIRVPIGPMVFSVQRSDDSNYLEVALLRKVQEENGRRHGGGGGGRMKEKKHMQMYIPMYLAATTFGWTLTAIKAVGVITVKALFISKLALIIAAALIIKKLMESAAEKMYIPHYPEHHHEHPFVLPYNMEFAHLPHALAGAEINPHELYSLHMGHPHEMQQSGLEGIAGAESSVSHSVQMQNATQPQLSAAYPTKVKRDDHHATWNGIKPKSSVFNYVSPNNPVYVYRKL